jgi:hypothetical protein
LEPAQRQETALARPHGHLLDSAGYQSKRFSTAPLKKPSQQLNAQAESPNPQLNWAYTTRQHPPPELLRVDIGVATIVESVRL